MVREGVDAYQRAHSQIEYAAIDSVNREEVQHISCAGRRTGVNRAMAGHLAMLGMNVPPNWSAVSQESVNHSNGNKDVSGDIKRHSGDIDILI